MESYFKVRTQTTENEAHRKIWWHNKDEEVNILGY